jgi:hypothetical protein
MASELTGTLLLTVIVASLGTWFPLGYNIVSMNGPQSVIVSIASLSSTSHCEIETLLLHLVLFLLLRFLY